MYSPYCPVNTAPRSIQRLPTSALRFSCHAFCSFKSSMTCGGREIILALLLVFGVVRRYSPSRRYRLYLIISVATSKSTSSQCRAVNSPTRIPVYKRTLMALATCGFEVSSANPNNSRHWSALRNTFSFGSAPGVVAFVTGFLRSSSFFTAVEKIGDMAVLTLLIVPTSKPSSVSIFIKASFSFMPKVSAILSAVSLRTGTP